LMPPSKSMKRMTTPLRPYPIRTVVRSLKRMSHLLEVAASVN
jgi:hypothetical protein